MIRSKVLGIVMAGGKGERLKPLTIERGKPAVPFGGKYRIVDFVLSNFVNSGIFSVYVLVQYMSQSLIDYLRVGWSNRGITPDHFITVVPPQMRMGELWYRGTADAVSQNLNLIRDFDPDYVAVFGADHIYRMDISQMLAYHVEKQAHVTISALPVPLAEAKGFGILGVSKSGRLTDFEEKPKNPKPMPGNPEMAYSSMGNYIFNRDVLEEVLTDDIEKDSAHDFGKNILPTLLEKHRVYAYNFQAAPLPGQKDYEEAGYWRDVGNLESYWSSHMDLLGEKPRLDLNNDEWPISAGRYNGPPARILGRQVEDSILSEGVVVNGAFVKHSVIGRGVVIHPGAVIEDSVLMDFCEVGPNCRFRRVVADRFNVFPPDTVIGHDAEKDQSAGYHVDKSGIVSIARGRSKWAHLKR
ncbi:MAG TPA: glucose-1-phosphate adenylyltransferase [Elusimicrobiota bacterium]|jgi:glucose-1-phosphate adenylyltransferase|nr:glucose-1-phosphate adenylyltransferase [Elusimicrobiota bacterium]HMZ26884.1 glucose-1-phosphate adenylyltransferase [Elusimicrobiota bacterium]HNA60173.1 glucose-1-phosphate adenylyltransferase [Elusimicrobiota bacterium]HNG44851.1 glucose-1-phosphate adenylyltransferase [Elusimicrobiota bacterium]